MVFSVSGLRRGVRRCLNGRHARAGRSPRASEVGAREEPEGLTAGARVTRWRANDGRRVVVVDGADAEPCGGRRAAAERAAVVYRVVVQLGLAVGWPTLVRSWRSHRPEGGSGSDRHPSGTRPRQRAWSPQAIEHGTPPAAPPTIVCQRRCGSFVETLQPSASNHRTPPRPRTMRQEGRSPLGQGAGGLRGSRSQPAPTVRYSERGGPARSRRSAWCRLRRLKGSRPAQPGALAALDTASAAMAMHAGGRQPDRLRCRWSRRFGRCQAASGRREGRPGIAHREGDPSWDRLGDKLVSSLYLRSVLIVRGYAVERHAVLASKSSGRPN